MRIGSAVLPPGGDNDDIATTTIWMRDVGYSVYCARWTDFEYGMLLVRMTEGLSNY